MPTRQATQCFQTAAAVVPTRSPKPILQNLKLEVTADSAMLLGTDLEVGIRMEVQGFSVEQPGNVILPVARFGSILRESADEQLFLRERRQKNVSKRKPKRVSIAFRESG